MAASVDVVVGVLAMNGIDILLLVGVVILAVVLFRELCDGMPGGEERAETEREWGNNTAVARPRGVEHQSNADPVPWTSGPAPSLARGPKGDHSRSVSVPFDGLGGLDQEQTA